MIAPFGFLAPASGAAQVVSPVTGLLAGLVAYWKLSDAADASGHGATLTNSGSTPFVSGGKLSNCAQFDGTGKYLQSAAPLSQNTPSGFAISLWVNAAGNQVLVAAADADQYGWVLFQDQGQYLVFFSNNGNWQTGANQQRFGSSADNSWNHVVVSVTAKGVASFYVNGTLSSTRAGFRFSPAAIVLGRHLLDQNKLTGKLDEVGVWHRELSATEAAQLYNNNAALAYESMRVGGDWNLTTNLKAHWKMDEASGTRADSTGAYPLAVNNTIAAVPGVLGNAIQPGAGLSYLSNASFAAALANAADATVSFWIKMVSPITDCNILGVWGNSNITDTQFEAYSTAAGGLGFLFQTPTSDQSQGMYFPTFGAQGRELSLAADGVWHHVVVIFKDGGASVQAVVDGAAYAPARFSPTTISPATGVPFQIGRTSQTWYAGNNNFKGVIDLVSIWRRALSLEDAAALFNFGAAIDYGNYGAAPANTAQPQASYSGGLVMEGETVSVNTGAWSGSPSAYAYQWQYAGSEGSGAIWTDVVGATASTFVVASGLLGKFIRAKVTAIAGSRASAPVTSTALAVAAYSFTTSPGAGSTKIITGYSGTLPSNLVIPSTLGGSAVTSIGVNAFHGCSALTSIAIPSSVTSISDGAFQNCSSLTSVTLPTGVTSLGAYAFSACSSLTSITIPSSVTSIGGNAFY